MFGMFTKSTYHLYRYAEIALLGGSKDIEYRLAQSGDATCSGLDNSDYGSRIMTLKRSGTAERCDFPKWFKEPKHWHSLNGELSYSVHQKYVLSYVINVVWWVECWNVILFIYSSYFVRISQSMILKVQGTISNLIEWNSCQRVCIAASTEVLLYLPRISFDNSDIRRRLQNPTVCDEWRIWAYHKDEGAQKEKKFVVSSTLE